MKKILFVAALLCPCLASSQVNVSFDGDSIPSSCLGTNDLFKVSDGLLSSYNESSGESFLFTPSSAMDGAEWSLSLSMPEPTSSCFARYYLASELPVADASSAAYFLRIGDSKRQLSLCFQKKNGSVVTLAKSDTMRLLPVQGENLLRLEVKVNRKASGEWTVSSKLNGEKKFRTEFAVTDSLAFSSYYSGIYCKYSKAKASSFSFDDWTVSGNPAEDNSAPRVIGLECSDSVFYCVVDEPVDVSSLSCVLPDCFESMPLFDPFSSRLAFRLKTSLSEGERYELSLRNLTDRAGNALDTSLVYGLPSVVEQGDLLFTEIMFAPASGGAEFVELYNRSEKVLDLSDIAFATRKKDAAPKFGKRVSSSSSLVFPGEYKVLTKSVEGVCSLSACSHPEAFVSVANMASMNNSGGYVSLFRLSDSLLLEDVFYSPDFHDEGIPDKGVGVSLERISVDDVLWTSALSENGYASPGYDGRGMQAVKDFFFEADRVCYPYQENGSFRLRYELDKSGYMANVCVYALDGSLVSVLADALRLERSGELSWDGRSEGLLVSPAPYVVLFEAIHPSGNRVNRRFVVLVSR